MQLINTIHEAPLSPENSLEMTVKDFQRGVGGREGAVNIQGRTGYGE